MFIIIVSIDFDDDEKKTDTTTISFSQIQKYIDDTYDVKISKSSITQVKSKCGIQKLEFGAKSEIVPELKTEKERLVLEAFRYYGLV